MSGQLFFEAFSSDPYVRQLHRRAVEILNDPDLNRHQRESRIRSIQAMLLDHSRQTAYKAKAVTTKNGKSMKPVVSQAVAHQAQIETRRREFQQTPATPATEVPPSISTEAPGVLQTIRNGALVLKLRKKSIGN
jgi:hypothetical protein